jgi:hypothetical protein
VLPQILWTQHFLRAQEYDDIKSTVYQDNQSTMLLANNGRASSSKRTRHLDIRYFFVTDRIAAGDMSIDYCPTGDMIADFFTKPLQGSLFQKFRNFIMNVDRICATNADPRSVLQNEISTVKPLPVVSEETGGPLTTGTDVWTVVPNKKKKTCAIPVPVPDTDQYRVPVQKVSGKRANPHKLVSGKRANPHKLEQHFAANHTVSSEEKEKASMETSKDKVFL